MTTKHNKIINYIEAFPIGQKLSVRKIAKELDVSEGTAYRAIKSAEDSGLVTTIERVGTIRIDGRDIQKINTLTFSEILKIIDGEILGGEAGLDKPLNRFFIGAMTEEAMERYLADHSLMIIGNRQEAQKLSLETGAAVLITGGFKADQAIIELANELALPLMSTSYDTFTVSSMINRAMSDQLIKKEILLVSHIYTRMEDTDYLLAKGTVFDYKVLNRKDGHSKFPIINHQNRLVGVISASDIIGKEDNTPLDTIMTREAKVAKPYMSVATAAHMMIWEGLEFMPVIEDDLTLTGIISRQDIMKAMQSQQQQAHIHDTILDQVRTLIEDVGNDQFTFTVSPQMTNQLGTISYGVLTEIITSTSQIMLAKNRVNNVSIEQIQLHYFKLIQLGAEVIIKPTIFDESRRFARMDVEVIDMNGLAAKALITCQYID
ncbi:CBS domain-containing protein [Dolosigranulum pigrum]|uniref:DRTGG domain-containing protein n=1 Tax=Dolosigranulum pigrum TaxID=29394 RepID=UPI001AD8686E|nr:DRTGG domain-containing protein [Dolosigranulum pigrum]QTJ53491.1 CBS domain-containing protein [Dolosigranulum pigrum]